MTKPITDELLTRLDSELGHSWMYSALRERLRLAEARLAEVEMHAGSDREERQYWEQRYVDTRDELAHARESAAFAHDLRRENLDGYITQVERLTARLALAEAVVDAAKTGPCRHSVDLYGYECTTCKALTAYRAAEVKP